MFPELEMSVRGIKESIMGSEGKNPFSVTLTNTQQFLLTAVRLCKEHGFVTDDRIISHFTPRDVLGLLTKKERADILALSGLRGDASLALAEMDADAWMPLVTVSKVSAEAIVNSSGLDRLVAVLDSSALWSLSTEKSFWLTPKEDPAYVAAHRCITGIVEKGFDLNLLTAKTAMVGETGHALVIHMTGDEKATLLNSILSLAGDGVLPDFQTLWSQSGALYKLPLSLIWEDLVIRKIAAPLGLLKTGASGSESLVPWSSIGKTGPAADAAPAEAPVAAPAAPPEPEPAAPPAASAEDARVEPPVEVPAPPIAPPRDEVDEVFEAHVISKPPEAPGASTADPGSDPPAPVPTILGLGSTGSPGTESHAPSPPTRREGPAGGAPAIEGTDGPKAHRTRRTHT